MTEDGGTDEVRSTIDQGAPLKAGANPNALHDGASLLSEAIENDDEELAKLLKKHGATEAASPASRGAASEDEPESEEGKELLAAAMHADSNRLRDLVLAGVDVNYATAQGRLRSGSCWLVCTMNQTVECSAAMQSSVWTFC
jgi:ankyrin repeat protein